MSCNQFGDRLTAFSLGELNPEEASEARAHLAECASCTTLTLRDRQLVSTLRSSAVPAPASVHHAVRAAVRGEHPQRRRGWSLSPRLVAAALTSALVLAALVTVLATRETPVAEPPELLAAWDAYHADTLPLEQRDPPGGGDSVWDLDAVGLRLVASGDLTLAGLPASATEYHGLGGSRMVVFNWRGSLPGEGKGAGGDDLDLQISSWGSTTSAWWEEHGWVYCAVGDLEERRLVTAVRDIRQEHP